MGTTFDIGMGAVFLLSSAAAYVSGDTLVRTENRTPLWIGCTTYVGHLLATL